MAGSEATFPEAQQHILEVLASNEGNQVFDRYRRVKKCGEGAFGQVSGSDWQL
jgi:hypothetical protein